MLVESTLQYVGARDRMDRSQVVDGLRRGDTGLHAEFRFHLARTIQLFLRERVKGLRSLHVVGSSLVGPARPATDLDLVAHGAAPSDPVVANLHSRCRDVTRSYLCLMGWRRRPEFKLIDLHAVTDEEGSRREGSAALLHSIHAPRYALFIGAQPAPAGVNPGAR